MADVKTALQALELDDMGRLVLSDEMLIDIEQVPGAMLAGANTVSCQGSTNNGGCTNGSCTGSHNTSSCANMLCLGATNVSVCVIGRQLPED